MSANKSRHTENDLILISACFLGERVRYNGQVKSLTNDLLQSWHKQNRLIAVCPEVCGGLPVPRPPAEINPTILRVITENNQDVTENFVKGAEHALALCRKNNIRYALLKESSPSCGSNNIYDGSFTQNKIKGEGVTTKLLRENGIKVFCENSIGELAAIIN